MEMASSGGGEELDQCLGQHAHLLRTNRPIAVQALGESARVVEGEAVDGQGAEQRDAAAAGLTVGVDEAEAA